MKGKKRNEATAECQQCFIEVGARNGDRPKHKSKLDNCDGDAGAGAAHQQLEANPPSPNEVLCRLEKT